MNDQPEKKGEEEGAQFREISEQDLRNDLENHGLWLASDGKEGHKAQLQNVNLEKLPLQGVNLRRADLRGTNLRGVKLHGADLSEARLEQAHLQGSEFRNVNFKRANLQGADLQKAQFHAPCFEEANVQQAKLQGVNFLAANFKQAKLQSADFREARLQKPNFFGAILENANLIKAKLESADLERASLKSAELAHAKLQNANLRNANLQSVHALLAEQLAGSDTTGIKLPDDIAKFDALDHVAEISKHARNIFLAVVGGCVYSWLTIATTTDVALVVNSASTPLPIIQTKVPIAGFYWAAPVILLALYLYLHIYMQRMWEGLASLPAVFPDGRTLDQKAYPWLLTGLVRAHVPLLKEGRPSLWWLQFALSITAAWLLVPITLLGFWLRYLPRHDWIGTAIIVSSLLVATLASIGLYRRARTTLIGDEVSRVAGDPAPEIVVLGLVAFFAIALSNTAISGRGKDSFFGYPLYANLAGTDVSTKPPNWTGLAERPWKELNSEPGLLEKAKAELVQVKPATLNGVNLRRAVATGAFLAKANMNGTNLQEATLFSANLEEAHLRGANLQRAKLARANFQEANLRRANLQGSSLVYANLQRADISMANVQTTALGNANLQWADLSFANLQRSVLAGANLQEAKLVKANLRAADLFEANLQEAHLDDANLQWAGLDNANLQEAKLSRANLQHADLYGANLQKADLSFANLQEADLSFANLVGADLTRAQFTGADLTQARLTIVNRHSTRGLTRSQLGSACGNASTKLPPGLTIKPCPQESTE